MVHSDVRDIRRIFYYRPVKSTCVKLLSGQCMALRVFSSQAHTLASLLLACRWWPAARRCPFAELTRALCYCSRTLPGSVPANDQSWLFSRTSSATHTVLKCPYAVGNASLDAPEMAAGAESMVLKRFSPSCPAAMSAAGRQVLHFSR